MRNAESTPAIPFDYLCAMDNFDPIGGESVHVAGAEGGLLLAHLAILLDSRCVPATNQHVHHAPEAPLAAVA